MRRAAQHGSIAGHQLTRAHEKVIARHDLGGTNVVHLPLHHAVCGARCIGLQRGHGTRGAGHRIRIECLAARLHEHHDQSRQRLSQQHRSCDGQHGHHVGGELTTQQAAEGAPHYGDAGEQQSGKPYPVPPGIGADRERRNRSRHQEGEGGGRESGDGRPTHR